LRSWKLLVVSPDIILVGDDDGVAEAAHASGARHIASIERNTRGTPLVRDVFLKATTAASTDLLMYVNADIIFCNDFLRALERLSFSQFLVIGGRWNVHREVVDLLGDTFDGRSEIARRQGRLLWSGADYMIFPRRVDWSLPPLVLGRPFWDNYLIFSARQRGIPVVDATRAITVAHPVHGYDHVPDAVGDTQVGPEADENLDLLGGRANRFVIRDATWLLDEERLRPARRPTHVMRWVTRRLFWRSGVYTAVRPLARPAIRAIVRAWHGRFGAARRR